MFLDFNFCMLDFLTQKHINAAYFDDYFFRRGWEVEKGIKQILMLM